MNSGIYIVFLRNEQPISVNAQDPRIADKAIRVTRANCKVGKAKSFEARRKNYETTFGAPNVTFVPIAALEELERAERLVLASLDRFRVRGSTGRKNEWLEGISAPEAERIAIAAIEASGIPFTRLGTTIPPPAVGPP